jgi:hypothetical protein
MRFILPLLNMYDQNLLISLLEKYPNRRWLGYFVFLTWIFFAHIHIGFNLASSIVLLQHRPWYSSSSKSCNLASSIVLLQLPH